MDKVIRENIPVDFGVRKQPHYMSEVMQDKLEQLHCFKHINKAKALISLGTLGGGNHFIEVDKDEEGYLYVIVHSGSRHLGVEITEYYIEEGAKVLKQKGIEVPYPLTWLEGELMEQYLADVKIAQEYAVLNREIILSEIKRGMKVKEVDYFSCVHNYVGNMGNNLRNVKTNSAECKSYSLNERNAIPVTFEKRILRKGAISAKKGERVIIPINMRDGVLLGIGKGNPEWNHSAPHGSGRKFRRDEVKNHYTVSSFKNEMKGIHCTCVGADTLDEAPFAYRSIQQLMPNLEETVTVTHILKPVYNYKAGGKGGQNVNKVQSGKNLCG